MRKVIAAVVCLAAAPLAILPAHALEVSQTTVEIGSQQTRTNYQIGNNTKARQSYSVDVVRTSFPDSKSQKQSMPPMEILVSPKTLQLSPGQTARVSIQYNGPKDSLERYYRLNITESAPPVKEKSKKRSASLDMANRIEAILVVRPRQMNLKYNFKNNEVSNTGNGYLVVLVDEQCGKVEKVTHYLAPGSQYRLPAITSETQASIAVDDKLNVLVDKCKGKSKKR
ncbi:MAG: fimbria/pilus periplasmic chaperone [Enterobacteriaceae bacterium]